MKRQSVLVLAVVVLVATGTSRANMIIQSGSWDLSESLSITATTTYSHNEGDSVPFSLFDPTVVPVPSAVILGSIGLSFSGWLLRKRKML